ncbi:MAG: tetratricopeptide repeat protein [Promethearchaeota archaeon]
MSESNPAELKRAEKLILENEIDEALDILEKIERTAWSNFMKGNYEEALREALKCKELYEKIGEKVNIASNLILIGQSSVFAGDYDLGLNCGLKSLTLFEELNNQEGQASSLFLIGLAYNYMGKFNQSIEFCERSLAIEEINPIIKVQTLYNLGVIYIFRGELDQALKYSLSSLELAEKLKLNRSISLNLSLIGGAYLFKGDYNRSKDYCLQSLMVSEREGLIYPIAWALICLISLGLNTNSSLEELKQYNERLKELADQNPNYKILSHAYNLGRASLLIKFSSRSQDRAEAEKLLNQIVNEKISNPLIYMPTVDLYCQFLVEELKLTNDLKVLDELNPLINRLLYITEKTQSYWWLIEGKLLQSKIALIQMKFKEAEILLSQAQKIAESHDFKSYAKIISNDHDYLLEQKEMWEHLKKIKAPMKDRINLASFDGVIKRLQSIQAMEPPELVEEEPIFLLIMDKSGISYFNYSFIEGWDYNWLFSSFMSAFDTFSSELFSESIDRIKIGENIILINPVESFLVCYVIKGQSYLGLKKLNRFSNAIKNDAEIWETLNRAVKSGKELELDKPKSLGALVNEIFNQ